MGVVVNPESALGKELAKWNQPYHFKPFPQMVYRARRTEDGRVMFHDPRHTEQAAAFNRSCELEVQSQEQLERALADGWHEDPDEALEAAKKEHREIGNLEAERFAQEARMSEKAQREAAQRDAAESDGDHVPVLEQKPIRRRRKRQN